MVASHRVCIYLSAIRLILIAKMAAVTEMTCLWEPMDLAWVTWRSIASFKSNGSKSSHASHSVSQHSVSQQSNGSGSYGGLSSVSFNSRTQNEQQKKKKSKLKLLGVVPIPGTKKVYDEDRREEKAKQRLQKMARRPSWEAGLSSGKY